MIALFVTACLIGYQPQPCHDFQARWYPSAEECTLRASQAAVEWLNDLGAIGSRVVVTGHRCAPAKPEDAL